MNIYAYKYKKFYRGAKFWKYTKSWRRAALLPIHFWKFFSCPRMNDFLLPLIFHLNHPTRHMTKVFNNCATWDGFAGTSWGFNYQCQS